MNYIQRLLQLSVEIAKDEIKSKVYVCLELNPCYSYKDGKHHFKLPNGKYHRFDGPACYGKGICDYYIDGQKYDFIEFWAKMKQTRHAKYIMANILGSKSLNGK